MQFCPACLLRLAGLNLMEIYDLQIGYKLSQ